MRAADVAGARTPLTKPHTARLPLRAAKASVAQAGGELGNKGSSGNNAKAASTPARSSWSAKPPSLPMAQAGRTQRWRCWLAISMDACRAGTEGMHHAPSCALRDFRIAHVPLAPWHGQRSVNATCEPYGCHQKRIDCAYMSGVVISYTPQSRTMFLTADRTCIQRRSGRGNSSVLFKERKKHA